jgi:hypothetical protein
LLATVALILSFIALIGMAITWSQVYFTYYRIADGMVVRSAEVPLSGTYQPSDVRIFKYDAAAANDTSASLQNTTEAVQIVMNVPVRSLNWTNDWFAVVNNTGFREALREAGTDLNEDTVLAPHPTLTLIGEELAQYFPGATFNVSNMPLFNVRMNESVDREFVTVCHYQVSMLMWSALRQLLQDYYGPPP